MTSVSESTIDRFRLDGRVAFVTGASAGLGAAAAMALAGAGADLVLVARRLDRLEAVAEEVRALGRRVVTAQLDVQDPDACDAVVSSALSELGRIDVLVNNAGIATAVPATRETPAAFRSVIEVNLFGSYWMAQACGRVMLPGSSIVNVGSVLGSTTAGLPQAAYSASKAAILGLTRDLAAQWSGRKGIRVNALVPGLFLTDMTTEYPDGYVEDICRRIPMQRVGDPAELCGALVFLASPASSYVTGSVVVVDGGLLIT